MKKKIPQRVCLGCGEMKGKKELIRIVKNKEGEIFYDSTGKANGRGAYICKNVECFDSSLKNKKIERVFKQALPQEIIINLRDEIQNG